MKDRQSRQHREEPRRLADLPAQREGVAVRLFHLRGAIALGSDQRATLGDLQVQLLLGALGVSGKVLSSSSPLVRRVIAS